MASNDTIGELGAIRVDGAYFKDELGRIVIPRGVNLSGATKLPVGFTTFGDTKLLYDHRFVSFVGKPFPLSEAHEHFARLKSWGLTFLRFIVTWEAIEHEGPGIYDMDYLDYVVNVLKVADEYGIKCFIDPHQDTWSRMSGGDGAPGWTFELLGIDIQAFRDTEAAIVMNNWEDKQKFPRMIWPSNYFKYACMTMFTLFFGGRTFAPNTIVGDVNIQDFLQTHYIDAIARLARHLVENGVTNVLGYETMNEPSCGYIGLPELAEIPSSQTLRIGYTPSPVQGMLLASGYPCHVALYERSRLAGNFPVRSGSVVLNEKRVSLFAQSGGKYQCPWLAHGVWQLPNDYRDGRVPLPEKCVAKPDYFYRCSTTGHRYDFLRDFWLPFTVRFGQGLREAHPNCVIFVEPEVNAIPPSFFVAAKNKAKSNGGMEEMTSQEQVDALARVPSMPEQRPPPMKESILEGPIVYAPHWYDGLTLFNKHFAWWNVDVLALTRLTLFANTSGGGAHNEEEELLREPYDNRHDRFRSILRRSHLRGHAPRSASEPAGHPPPHHPHKSASSSHRTTEEEMEEDGEDEEEDNDEENQEGVLEGTYDHQKSRVDKWNRKLKSSMRKYREAHHHMERDANSNETVPEMDQQHQRERSAPPISGAVAGVNHNHIKASPRTPPPNQGSLSIMAVLKALSVGDKAIAKSFASQINAIRQEGLARVGEWPCVIGETGIPYDMDERRAYTTNDYERQEKTMNVTISAMEQSMVPFTLWNYCPDNRNREGDHWNGEDFSIYSLDQPLVLSEYEVREREREALASPFSIFRKLGNSLIPSKTSLMTKLFANIREYDKGGRALPVVVRPYPLKVLGKPRKFSFDPFTGVFELRYENRTSLPRDRTSATEIFLPHLHYGRSLKGHFDVHITDGSYEHVPEKQTLIYMHSDLTLEEHVIIIKRIAY